MNWFKKAQKDWDTIYRELEVELGRRPLPSEVQQRLLE
jgi:hypothetical protein